MRIKICGLTRAEDVRAAIEAGADYLGFVFSESPRRVRITQAARLIEGARSERRRVECVGVFVDEPFGFVDDAREGLGLDRVQLHGAESPAECRALGESRVIKAFRPPPGEIPELAGYGVWAFLIEGRHADRAGGGGVRADWEVAAQVSRSPHRLFLAGGLTPENVAEAVRRVRPYAVDVSSGVESSPGVKDPAKIEEFVAAVRAAEE